MKSNHNIKKVTNKVLISSAIAGILGGAVVTIIPDQSGAVQNVQAKRKPKLRSLLKSKLLTKALKMLTRRLILVSILRTMTVF